MIEIIKVKTKFKLKAFSIAEVILALLITAICVEMLIGILGVVKKVNKNPDPLNQVAFSYVQLKEFLNEEGHVEIDTLHSNKHEIILKKQIGIKNNKPIFNNYSLEEYRNMIRLTGADGGHMPLILNLRRESFNFGTDFFEIHIQEHDHRNSVLRFKTDKPIQLEEDNKKDEKKDKKKEKIEKIKKKDN